VKKGTARAVVINSGNANACTGKQGLQDAQEMVRYAERALNFPQGSALVGSTGRIGVTLPMDNVRAGIIEACVELGFNRRTRCACRRSHHDSDTRPKQIAVEFKLGGKNRPHRRHLQRRRHDSAGHERHRQTPRSHVAARHHALFHYDRRGD